MSDRIPLDDLTSDHLDVLYDRLDRLTARHALTDRTTLADLHRRSVDALITAYPDHRDAADDMAHLMLAVRDHHMEGLEKRVAEAVEAEAATARVRDLHRPAQDWSWAAFGCTHHGQHTAECPSCGGCYPCATVEALDVQRPAITAESDTL